MKCVAKLPKMCFACVSVSSEEWREVLKNPWESFHLVSPLLLQGSTTAMYHPNASNLMRGKLTWKSSLHLQLMICLIRYCCSLFGWLSLCMVFRAQTLYRERNWCMSVLLAAYLVKLDLCRKWLGAQICFLITDFIYSCVEKQRSSFSDYMQTHQHGQSKDI